jgi:hypothetical protein
MKVKSKWSQQVTEKSHALILEEGFTWKNQKKLPRGEWIFSESSSKKETSP